MKNLAAQILLFTLFFCSCGEEAAGPTSIQLNQYELIMKIGDTIRLTASVLPLGIPDQGITWRSASPSVATVGYNGLVTAQSHGETNIVATCHNGCSAACGVKIIINFPDEAFRKTLLDNYGFKEKFNDIDLEDMGNRKRFQETTYLDLYKQGITSLQGIEYFLNLTKLDCSCNDLFSLSLSSNSKLKILNCSDNRLQELTLPAKDSQLEELQCQNNKLQEIDLSASKVLKKIDCSKNTLEEMDFSNNPLLSELSCDNNAIGELGLSNHSALTHISCNRNRLKALDLSGNEALSVLFCSKNRLQTLDLAANTNITTLDCSNNLLETLDLSTNKELVYLDCNNNALTVIERLDDCEQLLSLQCQANQLSSLKLPVVNKLMNLDCKSNRLTALDLSNCPNLYTLYCGQNELSVLELPASDLTEIFTCSQNKIKELHIDKLSSIRVFDCQNQDGQITVYLTERQKTKLGYSNRFEEWKNVCFILTEE